MDQCITQADAITIKLHQLKFVVDDQEMIQFAITPYRLGEALIFTPTKDTADINLLVIFNLSKRMKDLAAYNQKTGLLRIDFTHFSIFEEKLIDSTISFRDSTASTIIVDSANNLIKVDYHCKCNTPGGEDRGINFFDFWEATKQTIECSNTQCKERYHITCLHDPASVDPSSMNWKCPPCSLEDHVQRGKFWAQSIVKNTCTIDGFQTGNN